MKVCVLQPDYSSSTVDYRHYDPPRDLSPLLPGHTVHHVMLDKRTTHAQLKRLSTHGYDIFVNLCEGYLDWDVPSIDVIDSLERLGLPYTGPTPALYDPSKSLMSTSRTPLVCAHRRTSWCRAATPARPPHRDCAIRCS